jgi:hypothetical protein
VSTLSALSGVQQGLPGMCAIEEAVSALSSSGTEERGAIFTKREVADFILDLVGYTTDKDLRNVRLLEPSFGAGDFLIPSLERLLDSWDRFGNKAKPLELTDSIQAVEIHRETFFETQSKVVSLLTGRGISPSDTCLLVDRWLLQGDFLLASLNEPFSVVVGNPPYVRQEMIPIALMEAYRSKYRTIYDRADLYVPFIERSLMSLAPGGRLGFICADRWMKNRYGAPLRNMVASGFHLLAYVDMVDTPAFHTEVSAYPAIFVLAREKGTVTKVAYRPTLESNALKSLAASLVGCDGQTEVLCLQDVVQKDQAWVLDGNPNLSLLRRLEASLPMLEQTGCKVGIGVATGADQVFICNFDSLDVESDRKVPLAMTKDIQSGTVCWHGKAVINPFESTGKLVDLDKYPKLKAYLETHRDVIEGRHVAQKSKANWFRTIDRIYPEIAHKPKLLIPDIKGAAHIVYEDGKLYPHHNLYYVISDTWNLHALQAVLLSSITQLFISSYSTTMRGGYFRFQAQYLRKIRLPYWHDVDQAVQTELVEAGLSRNSDACERAVAKLYCLSDGEMSLLNQC